MLPVLPDVSILAGVPVLAVVQELSAAGSVVFHQRRPALIAQSLQMDNVFTSSFPHVNHEGWNSREMSAVERQRISLLPERKACCSLRGIQPMVV